MHKMELWKSILIVYFLWNVKGLEGKSILLKQNRFINLTCTRNRLNLCAKHPQYVKNLISFDSAFMSCARERMLLLPREDFEN